MKNKRFGKYLRECREPIMSLQDLADILDCSKPYLWDIEKGNTKPPQNYKRLADIANALKLEGKAREKLFDLAANAVEDIPLDIKEIINSNPEWIEKIRNSKENSYEQ